MKETEIKSFRMGVRDGLPICLGYFSVSFAFGIFATGSGLSILEAVLVSMFNVTSAGQQAAVPIIAGLGSYIELALTQLVINLRYALMSISLSQKMGKSVRRRDRFLIAFVNTDEVFAVASGKSGTVGRNYLFGLILTPYFGWSIGTALGAIAGNILPAILISALGIAIYAMFVAIVVPYARSGGAPLLAVLSCAALSALLYFVPIFDFIPSGFKIIICAVLVSALFALVAPIKEEEVAQDA
ncbi:MAG: AzlC family ABC transporter permease [Clostridia bacterium]|nr:AzlC family ABC transporter permease [Clostridia bacterium]